MALPPCQQKGGTHSEEDDRRRLWDRAKLDREVAGGSVEENSVNAVAGVQHPPCWKRPNGKRRAGDGTEIEGDASWRDIDQGNWGIETHRPGTQVVEI